MSESAFIIVKDFKGIDYYFGGYVVIDDQNLEHYRFECEARFYRDLERAYKFKTRSQAKKAASDIVGAKVISLFQYLKSLN